MAFSRYVSLIAAVQLAAGCTPEADAPPVERAGTSAETERAQELQAEERLVLAFGDSLYAGYGVERDQSFPNALEHELEERGIHARVVNAGVSGDTTAGGLARLAFTLDGLDRKPDLAVVGLGANDALRGLDPAETRRNLESILGELKRREIPVVLTGMVAPRNMDSAYLRSFDSIYPDLAKRYGAALDPFFMDGVITDPKLLLSDGMHPNASGIRVIAARVAPLAAERLRDAAAPAL